MQGQLVAFGVRHIAKSTLNLLLCNKDRGDNPLLTVIGPDYTYLFLHRTTGAPQQIFLTVLPAPPM
jgi:hypothetical protein